MNLNPFNTHIIKHPLNWVVVIGVALLGAMIIHHLLLTKDMAVIAMNKSTIARNQPKNQGGAESAAGQSGQAGYVDLMNGGAYV